MSQHIPQMESKLREFNANIALLIKKNSIAQEKAAISKMKSDPKAFYAYAKKKIR